jgi:hypothetical protein
MKDSGSTPNGPIMGRVAFNPPSPALIAPAPGLATHRNGYRERPRVSRPVQLNPQIPKLPANRSDHVSYSQFA